MSDPILGIHHITAIASDPQRNLDFYTRALGLRLVKLTVNFDDPGTYHFYFGDERGHPGTILTFFPWGDIRRGQRGAGQVSVVSFAIPSGSLGFWQERLKQQGITASAPFERFDETVLTFLDPDGLQLELIAGPDGDGPTAPYPGLTVPEDHAIRGLAAPTLLVSELEPTAGLLGQIFGLKPVEAAGPRFRFAGGGRTGGLGSPGSHVDLEVRASEVRGRMGAGVVHHIAWRTPDDAQQRQWRETLIRAGLDVTQVMDRSYFHSIYFREPNGILFEIATDAPGFATDESPETLGTQLRLPEWLEPRQAEIEAVLPPLCLPTAQPC